MGVAECASSCARQWYLSLHLLLPSRFVPEDGDSPKKIHTSMFAGGDEACEQTVVTAFIQCVWLPVCSRCSGFIRVPGAKEGRPRTQPAEEPAKPSSLCLQSSTESLEPRALSEDATSAVPTGCWMGSSSTSGEGRCLSVPAVSRRACLHVCRLEALPPDLAA